ncbi:hypothetical protein CH76_00075 [Lysinibacillus sp. BF-4]|uniref:DUF881 domain-containing protein n=1 Tax=Lysinibacillus sp. BF-4 TaxID=1473546 RepID=UPI000506ED56|nr:DUF881 domain-containing protein [Lysinibacillus sp. BF-4]KFL44243.1 hypothetical protein CH76_00075 [Lysinibacillus sp. BF-4]
MKHIVFSRKQFFMLVVCIAAGFIIGYSYNLTKEERMMTVADLQTYEREDNYREQLIDQQERNKQLAAEVHELTTAVRDYEKKVADTDYEQVVEEADDLRLMLGTISTKGKGVKVTLADADYNPASVNPNEYIVHESHVFTVINELKIAGAEAIAINGQRLRTNSYIRCTGPVIVVDGKQFPAPFTIEAIGDNDTINASLNLRGGVLDQLLHDNIVVTVEENRMIEMVANKQGM